jgi:hypothetical protein
MQVGADTQAGFGRHGSRVWQAGINRGAGGQAINSRLELGSIGKMAER